MTRDCVETMTVTVWQAISIHGLGVRPVPVYRVACPALYLGHTGLRDRGQAESCI